MAADRVLATLFVAALAFATPTGLSQRRAVTEWPVGAITRTFVPQGTYNWRGAATHALVTSLWYPAVRGTSVFEHDIGPPGSPLFHLGEWADDARAAKGPFPLIALSHGTGGSAQIMAWLARALASRGYVVAAVNHPPWSPHILRHTFCSHLAMRGAPVRAIQELAGHQDLSTTSRYMHLSATATESAIRLLEPSVSIARGDAVETGNLGIEKANR